MGGINHQPCRKVVAYLRFSTQMSRALSLARSQFELANTVLENILLSEMGVQSDVATVQMMTNHLEQSIAQIGSLNENIGLLRQKMRESSYEDLYKVLGLDPRDVAQKLATLGVASSDDLKYIASILSGDGYYNVFGVLELEAKALIERTAALRQKVLGLESHQENGTVTDVLENNLPDNIKLEFALLYRNWGSFQGLFLASSMISTEVWYRFMNVGSLAEPQKSEAVA